MSGRRLRMVVPSCMLVLLLLFAGCAQRAGEKAAPSVSAAPPAASIVPPLSPYDISTRRDLLALMLAYPGDITGVEKDGSSVYVRMRSGARLIYDDKKAKSYDGMLAEADLQDMMSQRYPLGDIRSLPHGNDDPGRIRDYDFFFAVYGSSLQAVRENLVNVPDCPQNPLFSQCSGAASCLGQAFKGVSSLIESDRRVYGFVYPMSGTFNYRQIAGTGRLSMHSFGIAVDLHIDSCDYWRWVSREKGQKRLDAYPRSLVSVFEENGFIWGGKWAHFDIVHYEYRPELIVKAKYHADPSAIKHVWYEGFPDTAPVRDAVKMINAALD